jgi:hypothetical protein
VSLKQIHIAFIALCVALMILCAFWSLQAYLAAGHSTTAAAAAASLTVAAMLVRYERSFLARCRKAGLS